MPAIIDSAPECVQKIGEAASHKPDDAADFILQAAYEKCGGIMTFGPGSTYGEDGVAAADAYYVLTYLGFFVTIAVIVFWVIYENKRLRGHVERLRSKSARHAATTPSVDAP
jgi:hypothetical protein